MGREYSFEHRGFCLTYQQRHLEVGVFDKRVGDMWNDNSGFNQVIPIAPFSMTNFYFNYTLGTNSILSESKLRFSVNNLFDNHNIVNVAQSTGGATYVVTPADSIQKLSARSSTLSLAMGLSPRR
jgi:iron complex outermembrane receptor protein